MVEFEPGVRNGPINFASFAGRGVDLFTERGLKPDRQSTLAGVEAHLKKGLGVRQNLPTYALKNLPTPAAASQPPRR